MKAVYTNDLETIRAMARASVSWVPFQPHPMSHSTSEHMVASAIAWRNSTSSGQELCSISPSAATSWLNESAIADHSFSWPDRLINEIANRTERVLRAKTNTKHSHWFLAVSGLSEIDKLTILSVQSTLC